MKIKYTFKRDKGPYMYPTWIEPMVSVGAQQPDNLREFSTMEIAKDKLVYDLCSNLLTAMDGRQPLDPAKNRDLINTILKYNYHS